MEPILDKAAWESITNRRLGEQLARKLRNTVIGDLNPAILQDFSANPDAVVFLLEIVNQQEKLARSVNTIMTMNEGVGVATYLLGELREARAVPYLVQLLGWTSPNISKWASEALQKIGRDAVPELLEAVQQEKREVVRWGARHDVVLDLVSILRRIGDPNVIPILKRMSGFFQLRRWPSYARAGLKASLRETIDELSNLTAA